MANTTRKPVLGRTVQTVSLIVAAVILAAITAVGIQAWRTMADLETTAAESAVQSETSPSETAATTTSRTTTEATTTTETTTTETTTTTESPEQRIAAGGCLVRVNRAANTVTVYAADENGEYTVPVKAMVCSTGKGTVRGTFSVSDKYDWRELFGGVFGQYAVRFNDHVMFHSVPYEAMRKDALEYEEYNKLGTKASMGCIRLCVADAKWIYDNCAVGTTVEVYDDEANPGPLGKPEAVKIDPASENRGWDPTDPDPGNPWLAVDSST